MKQDGADDKRRVWHKLHLAVDINIHKSITAKLSLSNVIDGKVLPNLLKQTRLTINAISGDRAYDTRQCDKAIRIKRASPLIPQEEVQIFENAVIHVIWR